MSYLVRKEYKDRVFVPDFPLDVFVEDFVKWASGREYVLLDFPVVDVQTHLFDTRVDVTVSAHVRRKKAKDTRWL